MSEVTRTTALSEARPDTGVTVWGLLDRSLVVDLAVVGCVAFVLGLIRLDAPSLWVDEAFSALAVRETLLSPLDQYHSLYYAVLKPWIAVVGDDEWALRFPSVVAAMLASGLLVIVGRRIFDRRVGLVSGLLLATSPFLVQWSQQARSYSFVVLSAVLSTLLLLIALERGTRAWWVAYGIALSLVFVLQPVSALVLVPAHVLAAAGQRDRLLPHGLLAPCVVVVMGLPWAVARARQTPVDNWLERPSLESGVTTVLDVSGAGGIGIALAAAGLFVLGRARNRQAGWLAVWALGPFALALVASFLVRPIYLDRYLISAAPGFALLGAVALVALRRRAAIAVAAVVVAATALGLVDWYRTAEDGNWRGEGWRDAVALVDERRGEAEAVVVVPWWANPAATYYGARVSSVSTADAIWVLSWSETGHDHPPAERRPLGFGEHRLVESVDFGARVQAQLWRRGG